MVHIVLVNGYLEDIKVDAVVNSANTKLQPCSGACNALYDKAGREELEAACDKIARCQVGDAEVTEAFNLDADLIVHAVGPSYNARKDFGKQLKMLRKTYQSALGKADYHGAESIACPIIGAGRGGFPTSDAVECAIESLDEPGFTPSNVSIAFIVVPDKAIYKFVKTCLFRALTHKSKVILPDIPASIVAPTGIKRAFGNDVDPNPYDDPESSVDEEFIPKPVPVPGGASSSTGTFDTAPSSSKTGIPGGAAAGACSCARKVNGASGGSFPSDGANSFPRSRTTTRNKLRSRSDRSRSPNEMPAEEQYNVPDYINDPRYALYPEDF